ncbi:rhodanese-like domain-containing protein [Fodinisporobacter ferrooxydans]|uniref:Rhodanese-like domain-containing protein n=1 Tax=Fodinisporobacter ferrooxydans TaxID=2901836 RepID=A0ABY4CDZ6_9BACL|nr:rhodanese-like domain-containing protein [Alicyclobacillaceae bacterium MYW30-H2]
MTIYVSNQEVKQRLERGESVNIIDVRNPDEVKKGMIPGAKNIPLTELESRIGELDKDEAYIFV